MPILLLIFCLSARAAETPSPRTVSLPTALELGSKNNLDLATKYIVLDQAQARVSQAHAASYPKLTGTAILSPIYSATGDALHSDNDIHKLGAWVQSSVTLLEPLYTWGKLSSFREAANFGVQVAQAQIRHDKDQLSFDIKQLYYSAVLAEQLYNFLEDGKKEVDDIVEKTEADQKKKRPSVAKREFYRLKIFAAEADYRFEEAKKLRMLARHALSLMLGFNPDEETLPETTQLTAIEATPPSEDEMAKQMGETRPEYAQLINGIAAKKALLAAEKTNKYPLFFAGGMLTFAYSNVRTGQQSAFAYDPYNRSSGGAGIGVQWTWDFATTLANESLLKTEIDELERKQIYARSGFKLELKKVMAEIAESQARLAASRDAFQIGKRWLVSETMGYSLGVGEIKNLIDAYLARAKTTKDFWDATYSVNMSWAELSRIVGKEVTPGLR